MNEGVMWSELTPEQQAEVKSMMYMAYVVWPSPGGYGYLAHTYDNGLHSTPFYAGVFGSFPELVREEMRKRYPNAYEIPATRVGL